MTTLNLQNRLYCAHVCVLPCYSCVSLLVTRRTVDCQSPLSVEFSRQEYWNGLPRLPPEDLPNLEIEPVSPTLQADSYCWAPGEVLYCVHLLIKVGLKMSVSMMKFVRSLLSHSTFWLIFSCNIYIKVNFAHLDMQVCTF